jgi:glycerol-3-phosphate dehydrogenase subunit C
MQESNISAGNLEQCLKCNLCTLVCPMMAVNGHYPGPKKAGPDGERYRLKDPQYYDYALKYCLNCKRCEVSCPSGVKIGDIIQSARLRYGGHNLRDWTLANTDLVGSLASPFAPLVNGVLGLRPVKTLMHSWMGVDSHRTFPAYSARKFSSWMRKQDQSRFDKFVTFFHGCYVNYNYPQLGKDLVKLVNAAGYGVHLLEKEKCCGVALMSNSMGDRARRQGEINLASMRKAIAAGEDILTVSSTCTFTMRDEYPHVLGLENADVRPHLYLLSKWLYKKMERGEVKLKFRKDLHLKIAYHTACHMQKLGWRNYTLELLRKIPGVELVEMEQQCCGISGTFGFKKENYGYSQAIGGRLFDEIGAARVALGAQSDPGFVVCTECETCKWQIEMSTGVPVMNPVSILAMALE